VVEAWLSGRYAYSGETWEQFRERVVTCALKIPGTQRSENVVIFTSATPVAICTGLSLVISGGRVMRLAGVLYNASYTVMRLRSEQLRLFTFNAVPHLAASGLRTHR
jgi:broad specificity phosphatase PhoE